MGILEEIRPVPGMRYPDMCLKLIRTILGPDRWERFHARELTLAPYDRNHPLAIEHLRKCRERAKARGDWVEQPKPPIRYRRRKKPAKPSA